MKFFTKRKHSLIIFFVNFIFLFACSTIKDRLPPLVCFEIVTKNLDPVYANLQEESTICQDPLADYDEDGIPNLYDGPDGSLAGDRYRFLDSVEETKKDGTKTTYYLFHNIGQIQGLWVYKGEDGKDEADKTNWLDEKYRIAKDIDASFIPIGYPQEDFHSIKSIHTADLDPFTGEIDGQGKTISSLRIKRNLRYVALFPKVSGNAKFSNMRLEGMEIEGGDKTKILGGLVGYAEGSNLSFENITIKGNFTSSNQCTGSLIGFLKGNQTDVTKIESGITTMSAVSPIGTRDSTYDDRTTCPSADKDIIKCHLRDDAGETYMKNAYATKENCDGDLTPIVAVIKSFIKVNGECYKIIKDEGENENISPKAAIRDSMSKGYKVCTSNVTDMQDLFLDNTTFNEDIDLSTWDVSNVTDMRSMFANATMFNQDISNWDVSQVKSMPSMFDGATMFNQDLSDWDVSKVKDMAAMFQKATVFNQNLSTWKVSNVTDMNGMFARATAFNRDISTWDVSKVTSMNNMFDGATMFNQDLSDWNDRINNVKSCTNFAFDATKWTKSQPQFAICNP